MEHSRVLLSDSQPDCQEISQLVWDPEVHHRVHIIPSLLLILSQMNPVYILALRKIHFHTVRLIKLTPNVVKFVVSTFALKLNVTHQLLVYADDVNILGGSIHTVRKNTSFINR
jgi:hypothetical protein